MHKQLILVVKSGDLIKIHWYELCFMHINFDGFKNNVVHGLRHGLPYRVWPMLLGVIFSLQKLEKKFKGFEINHKVALF
jgi:hypothetical protein